MNGLFTYHVPHMTPRRHAGSAPAAPRTASCDGPQSPRGQSGLPGNDAIIALLNALLARLGGGRGDDGERAEPPAPNHTMPSKPPIATTLALGEEDGGQPPLPNPQPPHPPVIGPPDVTTLALGEEDSLAPPVKPPVIEPPVHPKPPIYTTMALGEEDGGQWPF